MLGQKESKEVHLLLFVLIHFVVVFWSGTRFQNQEVYDRLTEFYSSEDEVTVLEV